MADRSVHETTKYQDFKMLVDNRQTARQHINKLKDAITRNPEILEVQPILVNEKMEIIDGQHRFVAATELGLPVHYVKVKGLDISTARQMNVMQRRWTIDDFAFSYAKAGNENYKIFNDFRRRYPSLPSSSLMTVIGGAAQNSNTFRNGTFVVERDQQDSERLLERIMEIREITGHEVPFHKSLASAFVHVADNDEFDMEEFIKRLRMKPSLMHRTTTVKDSLRMFEDIYNFQKSVNLIRLYG